MNLKAIAGVYFFGVIFVVKTALRLLKPGTRDPILVLLVPASEYENNKETYFLTISPLKVR